MSPRPYAKNVKKVCGCKRSQLWKCPHSPHLSYKPRHSPKRWRLSLDVELGRHIGSRSEAEEAARQICAAIDNGTFERRADRIAREQREAAAPTSSPAPALTVEQLGETYFDTHRNKRTGAPMSRNERLRWNLAMRTEITRADGQHVRFGDLPIDGVDALDIVALKAVLIAPRVETVTNRKGHIYEARRGGIAAVRGCLGRVRAFFRWALRNTNHLTQNPFRVRGETLEDLFATEPPRDRRLRPGEEEKLLAVANAQLGALIVAALETGCRIGELLSLQWHQVRFDLKEIHLAAKDTKARRARHLPMSQRLRSYLEMRRLDPKGQEWPATAYVFGDDATGTQVKSVKIAWENCRLKANGHTVEREATGRLTTECRRLLAAIDLRFHDLRREAGSRFLELGMAPHYVQAFLDHAKLSTTSRYLTIDARGMHAAMENAEKARKLAARKAKRAARGKLVANAARLGKHPKVKGASKSVQ
jgi:integrase